MKPTVTIGIPAYNEQANIVPLLEAVCSQRALEFVLQEVIVVCDGSTDETLALVDTFCTVKDKRVRLINNRQRKGQAYSQNVIAAQCQSDILVLLEADTLPQDALCLEHLIKPFASNPSLGMAQGDATSIEPSGWFESVLKVQKDIYHQISKRDHYIRGFFTSGRGPRAFARFVYSQLRWPLAVPEDAYALLWCKQRNIATAFEERAACFYRCPQTFNDFLRERQKFIAGKAALQAYSNRKDIEAIYSRPLSLRLTMLLTFLLRNPVACGWYILFTMKLAMRLTHVEFSDFLPPTQSTKNHL